MKEISDNELIEIYETLVQFIKALEGSKEGVDDAK